MVGRHTRQGVTAMPDMMHQKQGNTEYQMHKTTPTCDAASVAEALEADNHSQAMTSQLLLTRLKDCSTAMVTIKPRMVSVGWDGLLRNIMTAAAYAGAAPVETPHSSCLYTAELAGCAESC